MKKSLILSIALIVPLISASKCDDDGDGVDPDSASSICDHVMDLCGDDFFDGDKEACIDAVDPLESCRKECAADQDSCDTVDQCLWWSLGYDGAVDDYCEPGSGSYASLEECAQGECSWQNTACDQNWECTGIFDDCMASCSDWDCVETCANANYSGGIEDFNSLWTCLGNYCADFLQ